MPEEQWDKLMEICRGDRRYARGAYLFIFEALEHTVRKLGVRRHVTGKELLEGIRQFSRRQFGPLAKTVFRRWGIQSTDDFGQVVFRLVEVGLLGKTETDSVEDFHQVFDFDTAFPDTLGEWTDEDQDQEKQAR